MGEHDERKSVDMELRGWLRDRTTPDVPWSVIEAAAIAALDVIEDDMSVNGGDWLLPGDGR